MNNKEQPIDFDLAEVLWTLNLLSPLDMPTIAALALAEGIETPELIELAGLSEAETDEASILLRKAFHSMGRGNMSKKEAVRRYARKISHDIILERTAAIDGARAIWNAALNVEDAEFHEVDPFIYAASEYDSRPRDREFFEGQVRAEAARWVNDATRQN